MSDQEALEQRIKMVHAITEKAVRTASEQLAELGELINQLRFESEGNETTDALPNKKEYDKEAMRELVVRSLLANVAEDEQATYATLLTNTYQLAESENSILPEPKLLCQIVKRILDNTVMKEFVDIQPMKGPVELVKTLKCCCNSCAADNSTMHETAIEARYDKTDVGATFNTLTRTQGAVMPNIDKEIVDMIAGSLADTINFLIWNAISCVTVTFENENNTFDAEKIYGATRDRFCSLLTAASSLLVYKPHTPLPNRLLTSKNTMNMIEQMSNLKDLSRFENGLLTFASSNTPTFSYEPLEQPVGDGQFQQVGILTFGQQKIKTFTRDLEYMVDDSILLAYKNNNTDAAFWNIDTGLTWAPYLPAVPSFARNPETLSIEDLVVFGIRHGFHATTNNPKATSGYYVKIPLRLVY